MRFVELDTLTADAHAWGALREAWGSFAGTATNATVWRDVCAASEGVSLVPSAVCAACAVAVAVVRMALVAARTKSAVRAHEAPGT
jgi:hypothetical protein